MSKKAACYNPHGRPMDEPRYLNKRYQLLEPLGKGGMAVVYRARDMMLERFVAIKVLREETSRNPAFEARFRQEAKAAANLSHPNIVTVHDFGLDHGQLFLVMEYVPGTELKILIQQRGHLTSEQALPLIIQACAGIGYAHRAGLVHCDVKPQNMLVTPDMRLKVADFGIARALATIQPDEKNEVVWGSPQYIAPEQASGSAPSPASDVYSLGIILYEMLTGSLPFSGSSAAEIAREQVEGQPMNFGELIPGISPALVTILSKVLSKEPSQRYRNADQLGRVLSSFVVARSGSPWMLASQARSLLDPGRAENSQTASNLIAQIDWLSVGLGLVALTTVLGLIPFWMWIYFVYNPPIR